MLRMRGRAAEIALSAGALAASGCAGARHMLDANHPWHGYPAAATLAVTFLPMQMLSLPAMAFGQCRGSHPGGCEALILGPAVVVGGAFWLAFLPLELAVAGDDDESHAPHGDPQTQQD